MTIKKSQALEFLMDYGWVFLIVLVAIGTLATTCSGETKHFVEGKIIGDGYKKQCLKCFSPEDKDCFEHPDCYERNSYLVEEPQRCLFTFTNIVEQMITKTLKQAFKQKGCTV